MTSRIETMVLGLLAERERHGYDLLREMEERGFLRWCPASKVAVYKVLARLEEKGYLTSWMEREGNMPEKRVYALTADGEERLRDVVHAACSEEEPLRLDYAVGAAFLERLSVDEAVDALESRRSFLEKSARRLSSQRGLLEGVASPLELLILEHEIDLYRRESKWVSRLLEELRGKADVPRSSGKDPGRNEG
ncbi:PadR family transcriptional regulator [Candidatus Solincola tengchongensis]|uniref:PadR family transcriptional regulator n=1 Tax=Candidatus Solincola tengchongensis TaxID=2900693 RepID=UPI002581120C|nr:PadR family transcriptional regulator [Candidatus Solincola tengchongensis]